MKYREALAAAGNSTGKLALMARVHQNNVYSWRDKGYLPEIAALRLAFRFPGKFKALVDLDFYDGLRNEKGLRTQRRKEVA